MGYPKDQVQVDLLTVDGQLATLFECFPTSLMLTFKRSFLRMYVYVLFQVLPQFEAFEADFANEGFKT